MPPIIKPEGTISSRQQPVSKVLLKCLILQRVQGTQRPARVAQQRRPPTKSAPKIIAGNQRSLVLSEESQAPQLAGSWGERRRHLLLFPMERQDSDFKQAEVSVRDRKRDFAS